MNKKKKKESNPILYTLSEGLRCPHCVQQHSLLSEPKRGVKKKVTLRIIQLGCRDCGFQWSFTWTEFRHALFKSTKDAKKTNKLFTEIIGGAAKARK